MRTSQSEPCNEFSSIDGSPLNLPLILLSGDNTRTASMLYRALCDDGFHVQFAAPYHDLEALWRERRPSVVLLEVSGPHTVEAAVNEALKLKRLDPLQFVGYVADPALHTSGLAGDAIFPRISEELAKALRNHFRNDD